MAVNLIPGDTLVHRLLHWERATPDVVYLTQPMADGRVVDYTWRQVAEEARRIAAHLRSLDLRAGSPIALLGRNTAHWIIADIAIWLAGHVTVPLYAACSAATARYILEHSDARLLFLGKMDGAADNWPGIGPALPPELPVVRLPMAPMLAGRRSEDWTTLLTRHAPLGHVELPPRSRLATILYTSGSTGEPKGVMHSFGSMIQIAEIDAIPIGNADRMLSYLPLAHAAERSLVEATSLYHGFRVFFCHAPDTFKQDIQRARPTLFFSVPRLWVRFRQGVNEQIPVGLQRVLMHLPVVSKRLGRKILRELGLDQVRYALSGSAPIAPEVLVWYRRLGLELLEGYGMCENFAISHLIRRAGSGSGRSG